MAVDWKHPEYSKSVVRWRDIDNVVGRENLNQYFRTLNPKDKSQENRKINEDYQKYAIFYNFTSRTLDGLVGEVFSRDPEIEIPDTLEYLMTNADGAGNSIVQLAQITERETLKKARSGLFTSFPQVDREISAQELQDGTFAATITPIDAIRIINWRESSNGLEMVVFRDDIEVIAEDGFSFEMKEAYRHLSMSQVIVDDEDQIVFNDGGVNIFVDRLWTQDEDKNWVIVSESAPRDGSGNFWEIIPFRFTGSINNDASVDKQDMTELSEVNIGHLRNSADLEDSVFHAGQSQPWMSGVNQTHLDLINDNQIFSGSKVVMPVPAGEKYDFATADPNPLVREAMADKIESAQMLGARFVQRGGVAKTAEQSAGEQSVAHSQLSLVTQNVSEAYTESIKFVARYMNTPQDNIKFELYKDFVPVGTSPQDIKTMAETWVMGAVPDSDYVKYMQRANRIDPEKDVQEVVDELDAKRAI